VALSNQLSNQKRNPTNDVVADNFLITTRALWSTISEQSHSKFAEKPLGES
jgi:hypothetical protein